MDNLTFCLTECQRAVFYPYHIQGTPICCPQSPYSACFTVNKLLFKYTLTIIQRYCLSVTISQISQDTKCHRHTSCTIKQIIGFWFKLVDDAYQVSSSHLPRGNGQGIETQACLLVACSSMPCPQCRDWQTKSYRRLLYSLYLDTLW